MLIDSRYTYPTFKKHDPEPILFVLLARSRKLSQQIIENEIDAERSQGICDGPCKSNL